MVKIKDLSHKQLIAQLEKYEKVYNQLLDERKKRFKEGVKKQALMTALEKKKGFLHSLDAPKAAPKAEPVAASAPAAEDNANPDATQAYHLKFDEMEINQLNEAAADAPGAAAEAEEEEVRVTQLLKLSKEQLAELRGVAESKKKKK